MSRLLVASTLIVGLGVAIATRGDPVVPRPPATAVSEQELASLTSATAWLNTAPLTAAALRGKVVLVQVWTFSCINWLRTMPYVRAWNEKYQDQGLVVIGVHTPEFEFEKNIDDVRRATRDLRVTYPVAIDNDYAIWTAFKNAYWPALFLVDKEGRVRHQHFGEGDYERTEQFVQQLLAEAGGPEVRRELVSVTGQGVEVEADWRNLRSPETYLGHARTERFSSPGGMVLNQPRVYQVPTQLRLNQWALAGDWTAGNQPTRLNQLGGRIVLRFHARDLHLVMGPGSRESVRFRVLVDGEPPGAAHGMDVDAQGLGVVSEARMYQLIRQPMPVRDRQFTIEFYEAGVEVYSFTFG